MSESTIRAGVVAVIAKHADYSSTGSAANIGDNDYRIFAKGLTRAVVVDTGVYTQEDMTLRAVRNTWLVPVWVYRQWTGEQNGSVTGLAAEVQKVKGQVDIWPNLDGVSGVVRARVNAVGQPQPIKEGAGNYLRQGMVVTVSEVETPSRQE